jgi:hypothetical protein
MLSAAKTRQADLISFLAYGLLLTKAEEWIHDLRDRNLDPDGQCGRVLLWRGEGASAGRPAMQGYCHCQSCRSHSGALVRGFTLWPKDAVSVEGSLAGFNKMGFSAGSIAPFVAAKC